jgi:hypothetical protein
MEAVRMFGSFTLRKVITGQFRAPDLSECMHAIPTQPDTKKRNTVAVSGLPRGFR